MMYWRNSGPIDSSRYRNRAITGKLRRSAWSFWTRSCKAIPARAAAGASANVRFFMRCSLPDPARLLQDSAQMRRPGGHFADSAAMDAVSTLERSRGNPKPGRDPRRPGALLRLDGSTLADLSDDEWQAQSLCPDWTLHGVVDHVT